MARLDIGEALGAGFKVIASRPLDCLAWGVTYFLIAVLPTFGLMFWIMPEFLHDAVSAASAGAADQMMPQMFASQLKFQALQPLIWIGSLVGRAVVYSAIFRAVLTPGDRGFFGMRLGGAELWVGLVLLVQMILMGLLAFALIMLCMGFWVPTIMAARNGFAGWEIPVGIVAVIAAAAVFLWLFVRYSMAAPMSFAERQFRLFESWKLTRGHGWGLFGLYLVAALATWLVAAVIEGVIFGVAIAALVGSGQMQGLFNTMGAAADPTAFMQTFMPYIMGFAAVASIFGGYFMAMLAGPWAKAYQQLAAHTDASRAEVF